MTEMMKNLKFKILLAVLFAVSVAYGARYFEDVVMTQADVDNIRLNGNTISTTNTNGDLTFDLNGSGASIFADLTASTVPYLDASKKLTSSAVTPTQLSYLDATSSIQTQLNGKQATGNYITALTSDVTASGPGSASATIASDAVTFSKMQNIATDSLIGRDTASTGDPENILLNSTLSMDGSGNLQRAALTGDVTASAGSNSTTIANDAVTFAKFQNITDNRLLGRSAGSGGDMMEITVGAGLSLSGGSLSNTTAPGTLAYRAVTTTDTVATSDDTLDLSGASFTSTLPTAAGNTGKTFKFIHNGTSLTNVYTIATVSSQNITGKGASATTFLLYTKGETLTIQSTGSAWAIVGHDTDSEWTSYTPTFTGFGTVSTQSFFWMRQGNNMYIRGYFISGTPTAVAAKVTMPGSMTINTAQITARSTQILGDVIGNVSTTVQAFPVTGRGKWSVYYDTDNTILSFANQTDKDNDAAGTLYRLETGNNIAGSADGVMITTGPIPITQWYP